MAAFPSIEPIGRGYDLGSHPLSAVGSANGDETRFVHGSESSSVPVTLELPPLTLAKALEIENHYLGQKGGRPFVLPVDTWRMHASRYDVVPAEHAWIYAEPPTRDALPGGLYRVTVSLLSVF